MLVKMLYTTLVMQTFLVSGLSRFPLPCIVYVPGEGFDFFSSSKFKGDSHGDGKYAYHGFVLDGGVLRRVKDAKFPRQKVQVAGYIHTGTDEEKPRAMTQVCYGGTLYDCDHQSTADFGMFGGGITFFL